MARKKTDKSQLNGSKKEIVENNLVKALSHPLRARALAILNERVASPKEIAEQLDREVGNVSYHVKKLEDFGCIEMVSTAQRRGATEHYYRGITRSFLNAENWAKLPADAKNGVSVAGLKMQNDASLAALEAGTFDSREDRHLSITPVTIDEEGWGEVVELLAGTLEGVLEIQARAANRLGGKGNAAALRATISLLGFESPQCEPEDDKEG